MRCVSTLGLRLQSALDDFGLENLQILVFNNGSMHCGITMANM